MRSVRSVGNGAAGPVVTAGKTAVGEPLNTRLNIAGPEIKDLVDLARRTFAACGQDITLVLT